MKHLVLFIRGIPGSGKSFLSKELSKYIEANIIDPDFIPSSEQTHESRLFKYKSNFTQCINYIKNDKSVIWCQPWRKIKNIDLTIENIKEISKKDVFFLIIDIQIDPRKAWSRIENKFPSYKDYLKYIATYSNNNLDYPKITLKGDNTIDNNVGVVINFLKKEL